MIGLTVGTTPVQCYLLEEDWKHLPKLPDNKTNFM